MTSTSTSLSGRAVSRTVEPNKARSVIPRRWINSGLCWASNFKTSSLRIVYSCMLSRPALGYAGKPLTQPTQPEHFFHRDRLQPPFIVGFYPAQSFLLPHPVNFRIGLVQAVMQHFQQQITIRSLEAQSLFNHVRCTHVCSFLLLRILAQEQPVRRVAALVPVAVAERVE